MFYRKRAQGVISLAEKIPVPFATLNQPQPLLCPLSLVSVPTAAVHGGGRGQLVDLQNEEEPHLRHPNLTTTTEYDDDFAAESLSEDLLQWLAAGGGDGGQAEDGEYFGTAAATEPAACLSQCCTSSDLTCSNCYGSDPQLQLLQSQYGEYPAYPPAVSVAAQPPSQQVMGELAGSTPRPLSAFSESMAAGWRQHVINASSSSALHMDSMVTASAYCVPFTVLDQNDGDCCSGDEMLGMGMGMGAFDGSSYSQSGQAAALSLSLPIAVADATITVRSAPSHMSFAPLDKRDSDSENNFGCGDDTETDRDMDRDYLMHAPVALKRIRSIDSQSSQGDGNQHSQLRQSGDMKGQRSLKPPLKERCMEYRHMQT